MFQRSVYKKYLAKISAEKIEARYRAFLAYFGDAKIQANIAVSKEERFQEGFLRELFVNILGYTIYPEDDYNLITEQKNEDNAKKADGAFLVGGVVRGVVELKDLKTPNLDAVENQAFGYKNHQSQARYVVISNFRKIRFYIDSATEFFEWDLFNLSLEKFRELYVCLSWEAIRDNLPLKIRDESTLEEKKIAEDFYRDYSSFKRNLFADILERNPSGDKVLLFRKTQKLLDRFLFVFFAEDRGLLPPNMISKTVEEWRSRSKWEPRALYEQFKILFGLIDRGAPQLEIFAYNGGLFKADATLDALEIGDDVLCANVEKLSAYDFESDVDVDVLGRIFEHSLTEIEEVTRALTAEANGDAASLKASAKTEKTKRKSDGVFYTPSYITKYIVEATLGKLCADKKKALGFDAETFDVDPQKFKTKKARAEESKRLDALLTSYRAWLRELTICDPACGSGAFLNAALKFLIDEHRELDELTARVQYGSSSSALIFQEIETYILEHNLFGVDVNEESVEIARLALWLRTCRKGRKLNDLSANVKCGDSLIDDEALGGARAFDWRREFPQVFEKGGFDVVIGNPPYVQLQTSGDVGKRLARAGYATFDKRGDLYCLFAERGYDLLKDGGALSYIMPNKWLITDYGKPLRKFFADKNLTQLLNFGDVQFFADATTNVLIFVAEKTPKGETLAVLSVNQKTYNGDFCATTAGRYPYAFEALGDDSWMIQAETHYPLLQKMRRETLSLKDLPISIFRGILTGYNDAYYIDAETKERLIAEHPTSKELIVPLLRGREVWKYGTRAATDSYLLNVHNGVKSQDLSPIDIENYPAIKQHLDQFYPQLAKRYDKGITPYNLRNCVYLDEFRRPKIIYPNMTAFFPFMYDESELFCNQKAFIITANDDSVSLKFLTALFNSQAAKIWIWYHCPELMGGTRELSKIYFEKFPVPDVGAKREFFETRVDERLAAFAMVRKTRRRFLRRLREDFPDLKATEKLENFDEATFAAFCNELKKQKIKLTPKARDEWEDYFDAQLETARAANARCAELDAELDAAVADLYGFDADERAVLRAFTL